MNHRAIIYQRPLAIPLSIYIHFPWCLSKCPYCDFNSHVLADNEIIAVYSSKILADLALEAKIHFGAKLESIYFGGGTPSLFYKDNLREILDFIKSNFDVAEDAEITLEANPGTIDQESCKNFKTIGINRMSLGVQSFSDKKLKKIGRIHGSKEAITAIKGIKAAGFTNFNIDLMFGLPGQDVKEAVEDLKIAMSFDPPHISWYQLTIEPNTKFGINAPLDLPESELLWDIQQQGKNFLSKSGMEQYEVAAFCRNTDSMCKHNVNYWQYGDYLGVGAGAHSKITDQNYLVKRYWKVAKPGQYLKAADFVEGEEIVDAKQLPLEFMLNALRLYQPITYDLFQERTGVTIAAIKEQLESAQDLGLLELKNGCVTTTEHGKNFLNDLLEIFI